MKFLSVLFVLLFSGEVMAGQIRVLTGTDTDPSTLEQISAKMKGFTFIAGPSAGARLPGADGIEVLEFHFVCYSASGTPSLKLSAFGSAVIYFGDTLIPVGPEGYVYLSGNGSHITVKSINGNWVLTGEGLIQIGTDFSTTPTIIGRRASLRSFTRSVVVGASSIHSGASSSAPSAVELGWSFAAGATNYLGLQLPLPDEWQGTNVTVRVHYMRTSVTAGTVKWQIRYKKADPYTLTSWSSWVDFTSSESSGGNYAHGIAVFDPIDMGLVGSPVNRRLLAIEIRRLSSGGSADTYPDPAVLSGVGFHFVSETPGID